MPVHEHHELTVRRGRLDCHGVDLEAYPCRREPSHPNPAAALLARSRLVERPRRQPPMLGQWRRLPLRPNL